MSNANPYAPPAAWDPKVPYEAAPLPPGFQRYKADPVATRAAIRRRYILYFLTYGAWIVWRAIRNAQTSTGAIPGLVTSAVVMAIVAARWKGVADQAILHYELITSPRFVRRAAPQGVAEILVEDMAEVRESTRALVFFSRVPRQVFVVPRTLLGYDEIRVRTAAFRSIAPIGGWELWRRSRFVQWHNEIDPARVAHDPSLAYELQTLRSVFTYRPRVAVPRRRWLRAVFLWFVLIVMFLAIWQFLSPAPRTRRPRQPAAGMGTGTST